MTATKSRHTVWLQALACMFCLFFPLNAPASPLDSLMHPTSADPKLAEAPTRDPAQEIKMATEHASEVPHIPVFVRLPNGFGVLVAVDDRFPLVSTRLFVRAGSAYEDPAEAGISHVLEHMAFKSSLKRPGGSAAQEIEAVGGSTNAATSFDYTVYMGDVPAEHWRVPLEVIEDMLFGAAFKPDELESEKKVVLSELDRGEDNPDSLLFKALQSMLFPDTSYAWPIIGYRETVSAITPQSIRAYRDKQYQPMDMLLVVVGKVDAAQVIQAAQDIYGSKTNTLSDKSAPSIPPRASDQPQVVVKSGGWTKLNAHIAFPIPGLRSAKAPALEVLAQILGGGDTSRLSRKLKYELRLVDSISCGSMDLERGGMLYIDASLDAENAVPFWKALVAELADFSAKGIQDEELNRSKLILETSLYRSKETLSGLATKLGYFQFFGFGQDGEKNYVDGLRMVSREDLSALVQSYLRPEALRAALIVPAKEFDEGAQAKLSLDLRELVAANWKKPPLPMETADIVGHAKSPEIVEIAPNRTLVLWPDMTLPFASVSLQFAGGDALLRPEQQGLAELTAKMLLRGTAGKSRLQIEEFAADRATAVSSTAGRDSVSIETRYPSRFEADIFGLLEEFVAQPAWQPDELDRAKENQLASIRNQEDQPTSLAFRRMFPFLFPGTHYGYTRLGDANQVRGFMPADLKAFWDAQKRRPWVLSICGTFDRKAVTELARRLALATGPADDFAFVKPGFGQERKLALKLPERNQAHVLLVFPVAGAKDEESAGLELLRTVLAGQGGILFRELRDEKGLGYSVSALLWQAPEAGFLALYIGTQAQNIEPALEGFRAVAKRLAVTPVPDAELQRAKNLLLGDYFRDHQSLRSRASEASGLLSQGFGLDHAKKEVERAQNISGQKLMALAAKYLDLDKSYLVTVEP